MLIIRKIKWRMYFPHPSTYLQLDAIVPRLGSEFFVLPRDDDGPFGPGNDQHPPLSHITTYSFWDILT